MALDQFILWIKRSEDIFITSSLRMLPFCNAQFHQLLLLFGVLKNMIGWHRFDELKLADGDRSIVSTKWGLWNTWKIDKFLRLKLHRHLKLSASHHAIIPFSFMKRNMNHMLPVDVLSEKRLQLGIGWSLQKKKRNIALHPKLGNDNHRENTFYGKERISLYFAILPTNWRWWQQSTHKIPLQWMDCPWR